MLLVDVGILDDPTIDADIARGEVAAAAGADIAALAGARDRAQANDTMGRGAAEIVLRLHAEGRLDAIGGSDVPR